mmetsp:Transcript_26917/g.82855  ORF Transcript_26917/g.82855 Transcript_26917/m.82855 type:complete len:206 (+) Transcript_26917:158-775(+)
MWSCFGLPHTHTPNDAAVTSILKVVCAGGAGSVCCAESVATGFACGSRFEWPGANSESGSASAGIGRSGCRFGATLAATVSSDVGATATSAGVWATPVDISSAGAHEPSSPTVAALASSSPSPVVVAESSFPSALAWSMDASSNRSAAMSGSVCVGGGTGAAMSGLKGIGGGGALLFGGGGGGRGTLLVEDASGSKVVSRLVRLW